MGMSITLREVKVQLDDSQIEVIDDVMAETYKVG